MNKALLIACALVTSVTIARGEDQIITTVPQGTQYETVYGSSKLTFLTAQGGLASFTDNAGYNTRIVVDGSKMYLHNIVREYPGMDSWVVGEIKNDVVEFTFPQAVAKDGNGDVIYVNTMKPVASDGVITLTPDTDNPVLKMKWDGKTLTEILPGTSTGDLARYDGMIGLVNGSGSFRSYGEVGLSYTIWEQAPLVPAEGVEMAGYTARYKDNWNDDQTAMVKISIDGTTAWVQGLVSYLPEAWVKGTLSQNGNTITIESDQYMGVYNDYFIFFYAADATGKTGASEFAWKDSATLTKTADGWKADTDMMVNLGQTRPWFGYGIKGLTLTLNAVSDPIPANPQWGDPEWSDSDEMGAADFEIPTVDVNGQALDVNNLYYRLYYNGEIADPSQPEFLYGSYVEFATGMVFFDFGWHCVAFFEPLQSIGVQSVYKANGKEYTSEIITFTFKTDAVQDITTADRTVQAVEYFDLSGRRMDSPNGLCIRRTHYSNGTTATDKVVVGAK